MACAHMSIRCGRLGILNAWSGSVKRVHLCAPLELMMDHIANAVWDYNMQTRGYIVMIIIILMILMIIIQASKCLRGIAV